jgi:hypothetical protein
MPAFQLVDVDVAAGGLDLACFTNSVSMTVEVSDIDATTFCSGGWMVPIAGRRSSSWTMSGPTDMQTATAAQTSAVDEFIGTSIGTSYPLSVVPEGATVGNPGYFGQGILMSRDILNGTVGELATHSMTFGGNVPVVRGFVETESTIVASGNSAGTNLGAVSATQRLWACVHFFTAGGTTPSITVKIQSDDNSGFSSPTDRITFSAATAKGGQFSSATGAITDTYWRAVWTVSGTTPSFQTRILLGIY